MRKLVYYLLRRIKYGKTKQVCPGFGFIEALHFFIDFFSPPPIVEVFLGPLGGRKSKLRKKKKTTLKTLSLFSPVIGAGLFLSSECCFFSS